MYQNYFRMGLIAILYSISSFKHFRWRSSTRYLTYFKPTTFEIFADHLYILPVRFINVIVSNLWFQCAVSHTLLCYFYDPVGRNAHESTQFRFYVSFVALSHFTHVTNDLIKGVWHCNICTWLWCFFISAFKFPPRAAITSFSGAMGHSSEPLAAYWICQHTDCGL